MLMQWQSQNQSWLLPRHLLWRPQLVKGKRERSDTKMKGQKCFPKPFKCVCVCLSVSLSVCHLRGSCVTSVAALDYHR